MPVSRIFMIIVLTFFVSHHDVAAQGKSENVMPVQKGSRYSLSIGNQEMIIDPTKGGRIVSLLMDGKDFLTDSIINDFNWGSTFWLSPQRDWNWPPAPEIDNKPYSVTVGQRAVVMTSPPEARTGIVVTKTISAAQSCRCFILEYEMTNRSNVVQKIAPWEVTRVKPNGLAFFPAGQGTARGGLLPSVVLLDNLYWYAYEKEKLPVKGDRQLYADGSEGWLAQINDNIVLLKKFPDVPKEAAAPEEAEVELFASEVSDTNSGYVEIEHQGPYTTLQPGASMTWKCTWIFRNLPAHIHPLKGNKALVEFARNLIKE